MANYTKDQNWNVKNSDGNWVTTPVYEIRGLSNETKPTDIGIGSVFLEIDTSTAFMWNGTSWAEL